MAPVDHSTTGTCTLYDERFFSFKCVFSYLIFQICSIFDSNSPFASGMRKINSWEIIELSVTENNVALVSDICRFMNVVHREIGFKSQMGMHLPMSSYVIL